MYCGLNLCIQRYDKGLIVLKDGGDVAVVDQKCNESDHVFRECFRNIRIDGERNVFFAIHITNKILLLRAEIDLHSVVIVQMDDDTDGVIDAGAVCDGARLVEDEYAISCG